MLSNKIISKIKENLLSKFALEKIILFGSQATGNADNKSDIDLIVITELKSDKFFLMSQMRRALLNIDFAFDVLVFTNEEFDRDRKFPGTIASYAVKEGITIYER